MSCSCFEWIMWLLRLVLIGFTLKQCLVNSVPYKRECFSCAHWGRQNSEQLAFSCSKLQSFRCDLATGSSHNLYDFQNDQNGTEYILNFYFSISQAGLVSLSASWWDGPTSHPRGGRQSQNCMLCFFTLICVFIIVIVSLYIPGVYFLNIYHQTFHF